MAIGFARNQMVSRSSGGNAVRKGAYGGRLDLVDERTGQRFSYSDRAAPAHHAVLLPTGAPERFRDPGTLWNAVEAAERRKDSQVAREMVLALPADAELSHEDRVALAESFAREHFVSNGLAVQLDIHLPEDPDGVNWHAHLLVTTRRLGPDGLSRLKARDLDPVVRKVGGRGQVVEGKAWGELWREHQDRYFREQGYDIKVDTNALVSENHVGPQRMRGPSSAAAVEELKARREANREAALNPAFVLDALTRHNATFSAQDLRRFLEKQLRGQEDAQEDIAATQTAVMTSPDLLELHDPVTGEASGRFTSRAVREEERAALAAAAALDAQKTGAVSAASISSTKARWSMRPDQEAAFEYANGQGHLKLIAGRAGTGKSYTLSAIREAHERDGRRVIGLAPTNVVAQDMQADGFSTTATLHSALFQLKHRIMRWDSDTVVMVDEAAMVSTPIVNELLGEARRSGAKLILVGDDRQLPSIERGGMFTQLQQRHDWVEITQVTRQQVEWQRQAARDLADYRFKDAIDAFARGGALHWSERPDDARDALVEAWRHDHAANRQDSRFVFAYTNADVDAFNAKLRAVCRQRGDLTSPDTRFSVCYRAVPEGEREETHEVDFAVGDRVQFTKTDKRIRIYNGNVGTITSLDPVTGEMTARLDAASNGRFRTVRWNANEFNGFRHGYAGTIYKGQGKTLDRTYLYHNEYWSSAPSYVALTRQRKSASLFVARETAQDESELARQMSRQDVRVASVAWASKDEVSGGDIREGASPSLLKQEDGGDGSLDTAAPDEAGNLPNIQVGRERFLKKFAEHRVASPPEPGQAMAAEEAQVRGFLTDWEKHVAALRAALSSPETRASEYHEARDHLMSFIRSIEDQPALSVALYRAARTSDSRDNIILADVLAHPEPSAALADFVARTENGIGGDERQSPSVSSSQPSGRKPLRPRNRTHGR